MTSYQILLSNKDSVLIFVDCSWAVKTEASSMDPRALAENWRSLADVAAIHDVPVIVTEFAKANSKPKGPFPPSSPLRVIAPLFRHTLNPWEEDAFVHSVAAMERQRLIIAGVHTEGAVSFAALSALQHGYDVYLVRDGIAGTTGHDHATASERMSQAGVVPVTLRQLELEWGREDASTKDGVYRTRSPKK